MAEAAAGVLVPAGVALEAGVGLGAVVVGKLEDALAVEAVLGVRALAVIVGEEVEREGIECVFCSEQRRVRIEMQGIRGVGRTGDEIHAEDLEMGCMVI